MKIVRYGEIGAEKPGILDSQGRVRALYPLIEEADARLLAPEFQARLAALDIERLPLVAEGVRLGMPLVGIRQIIAVAVNYRAHAAERGNEVPTEPMIFHKSISSLSGPMDDIALPPDSNKNDWEIELGIFIGKTARRVSEQDALAHVGGYCVVNDISERHWQHERAGQFGKGKSFDTFTPIGPWLVTPDEVGDPQSLEMWLDLNGQRRQHASTGQMVYPVAQLVSYISQFMTLQPGDLIASGTPAGVGAGCNPPVFMQPGDQLDFGISSLGSQHHRIVRESGE